jgi:gliding motility-associated-like protein
MKVNILLSILSCWLLSAVSFGQTTFRITQDVASFDIAGGMVENSSGDLVFAGTNSNFIPFFGNIVKMNSAGTVQWAKAYTGGIASSLTDIKAVSSGGYIVTGSSSNGGAILIRVDENGNTLWSKRYQCPDFAGKPSNEYGNAVIETSDGGFVVAGGVDYFWDGVSGSTVDTSSALGFKVNSAGTLQWSRIFTVSVTNPDEHYFNDVAESADGYVFVGISSEGSGTLNSDGDYPRNALIAKTTTAGATTYINRWGQGNTSSQGLNCITRLSTGNLVIGGYDDVHATITRIQGTGGAVTVQYGRRLSGAVFPPVSVIIQDISEHSDGTYGIIGTRIEAFSFAFYTFAAKFDPTSNTFAFNRGYLPIGLSAILPEGGVAANQGYYMVMTDQQAGGFNYNIIRTDNTGQLGGAAGCTVNNITQSTANSVPTIQAVTTVQFTNATEASFTPVVTDVTATPTVHCITTPCTPPAAATTVTATPSSICVGQSSSITASGPGVGVTYNVYTAPSGGTNLGAVPVSVSPTITTTYYVETVVNGSPACVSTTRTPVTVTVNPTPTATPGSNSPVCEGATINLTSPTVGSATYAWTGPNSFSSSSEDPVITPATAANGGTYTLVVTENGCSSAPANVSVTVTPLPVANASSNSPVCEGGTINLSANTIPSATYAWTGPNGFNSSAEDPTITPATAATAGVYSLTITSSGCSSAPATTTVVVNPLPAATAGSNSPVCEGSDILLTSSGGTGYSWTGPNGYSNGTQNPTISGATAAESGTYIVTVTDGNGCQNTAQTIVSVVAGETISATATDITCNGADDGTATAVTSGAGPYTYSWAPIGGNAATATDLPAGTYTVTVTASGCSSTATATVNEPTVIGLTTSSTASSCTTPTGTATVVATGGTGGYTYSWSPSGGNGATASNIAAGSYTVTVTDANGCEQTATVVVTSVNGPSATISASSDVSCAGLTDGSATVTASGGTPGYTYSWSPSGGSGATASNLGEGAYTVTVTDAAGCTATASATIGGATPIAIAETITASTCGNADGSISVVATGGTPGYTYAWTPAGNTATISNLPGGDYDVTVTDANGCTATESYTIVPTGSLNVDVTPLSSTILAGETVGLTATVTPAVAGATYVWNPSTDLTCDDCPNPTASPDETTIYTVTVTSPDGCTGTASATVFIELVCGEYFMPTIFSPDGNLNNDKLCLYGSCFVEVSLKIYDRWGELVFETNDQANCWDGTYKGKPMNAASYVYVLELTLQDGTTVSEKGNVTLVR